MFRIGLGDCFLLCFRDRSHVSNVLIDCGTLGSLHPELSAGTDAVAQHLQELTGGKLDLVIATHEHADHLSGFRGDDNAFKNFTFGEVWMSWCEKPGDPMAARLKTRQHAVLKALQAARLRLGAADEGRRLEVLDGLLEFNGLGAADRGSSTSKALDFLRAKANGNIKYLEPEMPPLEMPSVAGARVLVLGPPRDEVLINELDEKGATYGLAFGGSATGLLEAMDRFAGLELDEQRQRAFDENLPFDSDHPLRVLTAEVMSVDGSPSRQAEQPDMLLSETNRHKAPISALRRMYLGQGRAQNEPDPHWRQIEEDWLDSPEGLALKLDNATNNSSLALAIELPNGNVLLFPGDAQVGNWQSWAPRTWPGLGKAGAMITTEDLLGRTVLYKVGHHGSHNATLREKGLEWMTSPSLVAMLPVDEEFAHKKKHWNKMPLDALLTTLEEKTAGRVIRADVPHAALAAKTSSDPEAWREFMTATRTDDDPLYIEHVIRF